MPWKSTTTTGSFPMTQASCPGAQDEDCATWDATSQTCIPDEYYWQNGDYVEDADEAWDSHTDYLLSSQQHDTWDLGGTDGAESSWADHEFVLRYYETHEYSPGEWVDTGEDWSQPGSQWHQPFE